MGIHNLEKMLSPESIAVIGASNKEDSPGFGIMRNLLQAGYKGAIYPVHPRHRTIGGKKVWKSIAQISPPPDLVIFAVSLREALPTINQCAVMGCGGALLLGTEDQSVAAARTDLVEKIKQAARPGNFRLIGPGSRGLFCAQSFLQAGFGAARPVPGKMAFVSQNVALDPEVFAYADREGIGFGYCLSLGAMLDVDFGDIIDYLGGQPAVSSIALHLEHLTRCRNFMSAARAVSRIKPVIVMPAGQSQNGHADRVPGKGEAVYEAAFQRAGIFQVKTFPELLDCAAVFPSHPPMCGRAVAIVSNAGKLVNRAVAMMRRCDLETASLSRETRQRLQQIFPAASESFHPMDMPARCSAEVYQQTLSVLLAAAEVDGILLLLWPSSLNQPEEVAAKLRDLLVGPRLPVVTAWVDTRPPAGGANILREAGGRVYDRPERAVQVLASLYQYCRNREILQQVPSALPRRWKPDKAAAYSLVQTGLEREGGGLTEVESKKLLQAYGLPVTAATVVADEDSAVAAAEKTGYPVIMKISAPEVVNRAGKDAFTATAGEAAEVRVVFQRLIADCRTNHPEAAVIGLTIKKAPVKPQRTFCLGVKTDTHFGPVLYCGSSDSRDRMVALPPLNRLLTRRLMERMPDYRSLVRNFSSPEDDPTGLEEIMGRLSQLVADFAEIESVDMNPVFIVEGKAVVADVRARIKPALRAAPWHLVVSPYPNQLESLVVLPDVGQILLRPVRPEDAPLVRDLFQTLSAQSIYYRFFSPLKILPQHMLARFTQIDYDREIALVAILEPETTEKMIGMARVITGPDGETAEFAILVGDQWHGRGVGAALLRRCLAFSQLYNIRSVSGEVLPGNTKMLALGRKLGFQVHWQPGEGTYQLRLKIPEGRTLQGWLLENV